MWFKNKVPSWHLIYFFKNKVNYWHPKIEGERNWRIVRCDRYFSEESGAQVPMALLVKGSEGKRCGPKGAGKTFLFIARVDFARSVLTPKTWFKKTGSILTLNIYFKNMVNYRHPEIEGPNSKDCNMRSLQKIKKSSIEIMTKNKHHFYLHKSHVRCLICR